VGFGDQIRSIGNGFATARAEPFKGHPLAKQIRHDWPASIRALLGLERSSRYSFDASPGLGQWSEAPWLAVLSPSVTTSAMAGYYPVYLYEPRFETVCLVMGQGAQRLEEAVGRKRAGLELVKRAQLIRASGDAWKKAGFSEGPFITLKSAAVANGIDRLADPWANTAAFGIRYELRALPSDESMASDLRRMLDLYDVLARSGSLQFATLDDELLELRDSGELPAGAVDGAKKVVEHRRFEKRNRNRKLIAQVKEQLGCRCQACGFSFGDFYGHQMIGFVEAHHRIPLHSLPDAGAALKPTADDFMVLCSNCHRAIHRAGCPDLPTFIGTLNLHDL
jgi:5-methylcytosine-specific restriction protein A